MNQTIVVDVIEPTHHIKLNVLMTKPWEVYAHGPDGFRQRIDGYDTLKEAQTDYPKAWCSWKETEYEDCVEHVAPETTRWHLEFEPDY